MKLVEKSRLKGELANWENQQFLYNYLKKENDMRTKILLFFSALFLMTSVLGCNMVRGAGQDIENAGGSIQRTVEHND